MKQKYFWQYKNGKVALLDRRTFLDIMFGPDDWYEVYDHSLGAWVLYDRKI